MQRPKHGASALLAAAVVLILAVPASGAETPDPGPDASTASPTASPTEGPTEGPDEGTSTAAPTAPPETAEPTAPPETAAAPPTATPAATPAADAPTPVATALPPTEATAPSAAVASPTGSISGRVTVPAGVDVTLVQVNVWAEGKRSATAGHASAASDGTYTVGGLPPGRYQVEFNPWPSGLLREYWNDSELLGNASLVVVGTGPVTGIDAALVQGATLSGTIRSNGDCDLTYVHVYGHGAPGHVIPDGVVKPDGTWTLTGLPTGTYWVEFDGRSTGLPREYWNVTGTQYGRSEVSVTVGETRGGIDIVLDGPRGCVAPRAYVNQVYRDLLDRFPDQVGADGWSGALARGAGKESVANAITASDEYRGRLILASYWRFLGRSGEPSGRAGWLGQMQAGMQIEDVQAYFVASDEFWQRQGSTPAGWVAGLYDTVLGRAPAPSEVDAWVARMDDGVSRRDVARGFLFSTEYLATVVDGYYVQLLDRHIDGVGKVGWVRLIQQGSRDEQIVAGILASEEYAARVRRLSYA